jgi:hypothetical protein
MKVSPRLDDLYRMVAHIYSEQNANRAVTMTFSHFVEVCGMLSIHDRKKKKEDVVFERALCKALGWYFPLIARFKVKSVEELIFRKFPYSCPYCRELPHNDQKCKVVLGTQRTVDHEAQMKDYKTNEGQRPQTLNGWQQMFMDIYPRTPEDRRSVVGLFEEIGELSEAIRVYDRYPRYFAGEAADVFSYIMGIANEYRVRMKQEHDYDFSLEDTFLQEYPGLCLYCGSQICICPSIPDATVGRMSKEIDIFDADKLFYDDTKEFTEDSAVIARKVMLSLGGYKGIIDKFPYDRGQANKGLVLLCLQLADVMQKGEPGIAELLRNTALQVSVRPTPPGSKTDSDELKSIIGRLQEIWPKIIEVSGAMGFTLDKSPLEGTISNISMMNTPIRILFCQPNPRDTNPLRLSEEARAIEKAVERSKHRNMISIKTLQATTIDDFRRALLENEYDVLHISGHGSPGRLIFEDEKGDKVNMELAALVSHIKRYPNIHTVLLNACYSLKDMTDSIASFTIGMENAIADKSAIEFARGFYDALGAGKNVDFAYSEGCSAVKLKGLEINSKIIKK